MQVSPANPYNTDQIAVSVYVGLDFFDNAGWPDPTKTYEYLLIRPASPTGTWAGAQIVSTFDCWTIDCWTTLVNSVAYEGQIPNNPNAQLGYQLTFPAFNAPPPGNYELMAIDYGDYGKSNYDLTRVATYNLTVTQNPNTVVTTTSGTTQSGTTHSGTTTCSSTDYICQAMSSQYFPYLVIGGVVLLFVLFAPDKGEGSRPVIVERKV